MSMFTVEVEVTTLAGQLVSRSTRAMWARSARSAESEARIREAQDWQRPVLVNVKVQPR